VYEHFDTNLPWQWPGGGRRQISLGDVCRQRAERKESLGITAFHAVNNFLLPALSAASTQT